MTETTEFADVALPAALWGEKTGYFTNARIARFTEPLAQRPGDTRDLFALRSPGSLSPLCPDVRAR